MIRGQQLLHFSIFAVLAPQTLICKWDCNVFQVPAFPLHCLNPLLVHISLQSSHALHFFIIPVATRNFSDASIGAHCCKADRLQKLQQISWQICKCLHTKTTYKSANLFKTWFTDTKTANHPLQKLYLCYRCLSKLQIINSKTVSWQSCKCLQSKTIYKSANMFKTWFNDNSLCSKKFSKSWFLSESIFDMGKKTYRFYITFFITGLQKSCSQRGPLWNMDFGPSPPQNSNPTQL